MAGLPGSQAMRREPLPGLLTDFLFCYSFTFNIPRRLASFQGPLPCVAENRFCAYCNSKCHNSNGMVIAMLPNRMTLVSWEKTQS